MHENMGYTNAIEIIRIGEDKTVRVVVLEDNEDGGRYIKDIIETDDFRKVLKYIAEQCGHTITRIDIKG